MKRILIVAGGQWQIDLVKKAKKLGHYVVCANLYPDSPAFAFADVAVVCDVRDGIALTKAAKEYEVDAIVSDQSDVPIFTIAQLNEALGLPGIGVKVAEKFTNKFEMRKAAQGIGIAVPAYALCRTLEDVKNFFQTRKKIVLKPLDAQSSRGVSIVTESSQLEAGFQDALAISHKEKAVLAEEYIGGTEFTIDGIKTRKKHYSLAISEKKQYDYCPSVSKSLFFTHAHPTVPYDLLCAENDKFVQGLGLPFGLTHGEYKFYKDKFYLMEIAARGGGTGISSHIVPIMSKIDHNTLFLQLALGEDIPEEMLEQALTEKATDKTQCIMEFFDFPSGVVSAIKGLENKGQQKGLVDINLSFQVGDTLQKADSDSSRQGNFILFGENQETFSQNYHDFLEKVCVEYE